MKHCPKCGSSRIRRGYSSDPLALRLVGFRELLCDACNLRFRSFVLPGTLPRSSRRQKEARKREIENENHEEERRPVTEEPHHESRRCPLCEGNATHRSHRRGIIEHLASAISIYPYRCDACNNRFLARRRA
jgi:hypothetical protein